MTAVKQQMKKTLLIVLVTLVQYPGFLSSFLMLLLITLIDFSIFLKSPETFSKAWDTFISWLLLSCRCGIVDQILTQIVQKGWLIYTVSTVFIPLCQIALELVVHHHHRHSKSISSSLEGLQSQRQLYQIIYTITCNITGVCDYLMHNYKFTPLQW